MEKEREDRILEAIGRQRQDLMAHMDKQFGTIKEDLNAVKFEVNSVKSELNGVKSELNSVKMAVMDNGVNIKELKVEHKELKSSVDVAVTNHESRIRRLEEKVGT